MDKQKKHLTEEVAVLWTNAQPAVAAFVSSIVRGFQDSDDVLQQVAVAVVQNFDKYNPERPFVGWAIGIAKNEILMYHRNKSQGKVIFSEKAIQMISESYEKESGNFDDMRDALGICSKKLTERARRFLDMRYVSEMSIPRIAQKLGMTNSAVYTFFHRIRLSLRDCINRQISSQEVK